MDLDLTPLHRFLRATRLEIAFRSKCCDSAVYYYDFEQYRCFLCRRPVDFTKARDIQLLEP